MASQFSYPDNDPDFEENLWNVMVAEWSSTPTTQPNNPQHAFAELHTTPLSWINNNVPLSSSNHTTTAATGRAMMPSPNNPSSRSLLEAPTFPLVPTGSSDFTDLLANDGTHNTSVEETQRMPHLQRGYSNNPRRRRRCGAQAGGSSRRHTGLPSGLQEKYLNATKNCCDWIQTHPGLEPSPQDLDYLSKTTHVSRQWIRELIKSTVRDQMQSPSGDSGYQTRSIGDPEITKKYESQQPVRRKGRDDRPHTTVKNPTRPFVCPHLCGWDFDKNAAWAKHELIHYPQHVWFCPHCQDLSSGKRVWLRKDHFKKHLTKTHSYNKVTEQHCRTSELPVASRFPRRCHIPGCNKNFKDWDDRMKDMASHMEKDYDTSGWGRLEDEAEYIGTEERAETIADSDSENSDQESRKDDDSDDSDVDQGGPGGGGSGSAGGSGRGQGMNGQGSRKPPPSPDQQRQPGTGHDSSRHSYNTWRGYTGDRMHILTGLATVNRTLHIRDSLPSTSLDVRKPDTTDLERDCEGSMVAKPHWTLRNTQCSSVRWLGSGATARVDEVKTPGAEETMARKVIQYQYPAARQRVEREAYIMHRLQHPHIVRLLKAFKDTSTATLFMRPAADYSLAYYIQTRCSTAPAGREIWKWFSCLVSGLYYMHKQGILHGDIKPDNILIFNNHIFYTDFGLSDTIPDDKSMISDGGFITKQYAAPEVKRGKRGKPSDIWSLGCVFLELVTIMLHRSITDFYDGRKLSKAKQSGKTVDSSYSNNMVAVAKWIKALRQVSYMDQASAPVLTGLDSCQRMMILEPKQRMSALQLSSRMPPRPCCVSCQHASPRHDKPLDSHSFVSRDAMNYLFKRRCQATSHGASGKVLADVDTLPRSERNPWPRVMGSIHRRHTALSDEGIPMPESSTLSHWLSEPNSYEALVTGHVDIFKTRSKSFVIDFLDSLINKIDSQCVTTLSAEGQLFESHEIVDSHDHVETAGQGDLTNWFSQCNAEEDIRDVSVLNKPTQSELHVYSRAKHIWLHVTCTLDTRTRQDCVSQELVDKLGVQNDASFHCVEKPEFRHDKTKQCRTVKLSWYESTSRQTRENWFVVVEGSFDIVIGSDFLLTHAVFTYRQSAIWTSDWRRAQGKSKLLARMIMC